jgi:putative two-component system response regulator
MEIMKHHSMLGCQAILQAERALGTTVEFLFDAKEIARSHHEKWDGSGYPDELSSTDIPLPARLMAVADVYDALISRRVYKAPIPHDKAVKIILEGRGNHFDPDLVDAFNDITDRFALIASTYRDEDPNSSMVRIRREDFGIMA